MPWRSILLSGRGLSRFILFLIIFLGIFLFQTGVYSDIDDKIDINLENDPRMLAINPVTNAAVVTHWHSHSVSIVDLNTEKVIAKLRVGKLPKGVAIDTQTNTAVIANQADRSLTLINLNTNQITATIDLDKIPSNIAINSQTHIAVVTSAINQNVFFVDLTNRKIVAKTRVGMNVGDVAIDPIRNRAFVLNKIKKDINIIDLNNYEITDTISLEKRPQAIDVNPETNTLIVTSYRDHVVTVIDLLTKRSEIVPVYRYPLDVALNTIDNRAVVLCDKDRKLLLLDLNENKIIKTYKLNRHPKSVAVNSIRNTAIVADDEKDELTIIPLLLSPTLPKIKITSPQDGAQITTSSVVVTGTVENSEKVTVNNISAVINGNTFSATITLNEGTNTIAATATDKYGRTACDNITVNVTLPKKGTITGTVTNGLSGILLPAAIITITDAAGETQTITTIATGTFSAEVAEGSYTMTVIKPWYFPYSFTGTVAAGETISLNIPLTPSYPQINNISVADVTENSAIISWTTDQPTEGIVEYGTTTAYGATASDSIEDTAHSITLANLSPAKTYHFRVVASSANGTTVYSSDSVFKTKGQITITIISPTDGTNITGNRVSVTGAITNPANVETGVTVNGIPAAISNNQFVVNDVSLNTGQNTITVLATDVNGITATKSITVNAAVVENFIQLSAYPDSGVAPLEVTLRINGTFSITNPVITSSGPGTVEQLESETPDEFRYRITTAGLYTFTATVTGPDGISYTDSIPITVLPLAQIDTLLRAKWDGLTGALQNADVESALSFMLPHRRDNYKVVFNLLKDQWPSIIATYSGFTMISMEESIAKYELVANKNGKTYVYQINFRKDETGLWFIEEF